MTESSMIPINTLQCPNCGHLLRDCDYPNGTPIDHCVFCDVMFVNGVSPRQISNDTQIRNNPYAEHVAMRRMDSAKAMATIDTANSEALQNLIQRNIEALGLGLETLHLSAREFDRFKLSFKRTFDRPQIIDNFVKHYLDLLMGAMIAKRQFDMEFDGSLPYAGRFGHGLIMPYHMGRDFWALDSNPTYIDIKVGSEMLLVITGFMDAVGGGGIRQIQVVQNGKKRSWLSTQPSFASAEIMDLDEAFFLRKDDTFSLEYRPKQVSSAQLQPVGLAFTPEAIMRDPKIGKAYGMVENLRKPLSVQIQEDAESFMHLIEKWKQNEMQIL